MQKRSKIILIIIAKKWKNIRILNYLIKNKIHYMILQAKINKRRQPEIISLHRQTYISKWIVDKLMMTFPDNYAISVLKKKINKRNNNIWTPILKISRIFFKNKVLFVSTVMISIIIRTMAQTKLINNNNCAILKEQMISVIIW